MFPCCQKEEADELYERIQAQVEAASPSKLSNNVIADEESKSDMGSSNKDEVTSCSSFLGNGDDSILQGVCTAWFLKCPPIDGNSHFENLQSTNWNSLRFKPPPCADSEIGWRVEFRPMDIQLTDFENTALTICVGMIANIINTYDLDFILPVSLVDENMKRAHNRNALLDTKFWWKVPDGPEPFLVKEGQHQESDYTVSDQAKFDERANETNEEAKTRDEARY